MFELREPNVAKIVINFEINPFPHTTSTEIIGFSCSFFKHLKTFCLYMFSEFKTRDFLMSFKVVIGGNCQKMQNALANLFIRSYY